MFERIVSIQRMLCQLPAGRHAWRPRLWEWYKLWRTHCWSGWTGRVCGFAWRLKYRSEFEKVYSLMRTFVDLYLRIAVCVCKRLALTSLRCSGWHIASVAAGLRWLLRGILWQRSSTLDPCLFCVSGKWLDIHGWCPNGMVQQTIYSIWCIDSDSAAVAMDVECFTLDVAYIIMYKMN